MLYTSVSNYPARENISPMKDVTLNQGEQARLHVLDSVLEHQLPINQAAEILGVTERPAWRVPAAYRKESAGALAHGNRAAPNAVSNDTVGALTRTCYAGVDHNHLTELLREREGTELSHQMVWRILTKSGLPNPRHRRPPKHRACGTVSICLDVADGKHGGKGSVWFSKYGLNGLFLGLDG